MDPKIENLLAIRNSLQEMLKGEPSSPFSVNAVSKAISLQPLDIQIKSDITNLLKEITPSLETNTVEEALELINNSINIIGIRWEIKRKFKSIHSLFQDPQCKNGFLFSVIEKEMLHLIERMK